MTYFNFLKLKDNLKLSEVCREHDLPIRVTYLLSRTISVLKYDFQEAGVRSLWVVYSRSRNSIEKEQRMKHV